MTLGRREAVGRAHALLDTLDAELRSAGAWIGTTELTPVGALRSHLAQKIADHLQDVAPPAPREVARSALYSARERLRELTRTARWPEVSRPTGRLLLFVPRRPSHVRDLVRVQAQARVEGAFHVAWLVYRADQAAELSPAVYAPAVARASVLLPGAAARALTAALARLRRTEHPVLWSLLVRELALQLPQVLLAADATASALARLRPDGVVVGNPYTSEGTVAAALAHRAGLPVATLQHGEIGPGQLDWAHARFDCVTVWGEAPRGALMRLGVASSRIEVTGAPWADALAVAPAPRDPRAPLSVLVALSGAGHAVGLAEHLGHVTRLVDAAARTPEHRWTFRLHPKDDPAHWTRALAQRPAPHVTLAHGPGLPPIDEVLAQQHVLITVLSASALDAMLHHVPVVTLARAPGEPTPGFVEAGATVHVGPHDDLVSALGQLASAGLSPEVGARAQAYVSAYFGPRDGGAAARVVRALLKLCPERSDRGGRA